MLRCNVSPLESLGSAMKVWITCFVLLFGATEVLQWVKQFSMPLPIFILGGAFLAIASNYDKLTHLPFHLDYKKPDALQESVPVERSPQEAQPIRPQTVRDLQRQPASRTISFTIRKTHQPGD
jgi:hypothetical protein